MLANKQRKNTQPSQQCAEAVILQAACTIYTAFPQSPTPQTFVQSNSKTVSGGIREVKSTGLTLTDFPTPDKTNAPKKQRSQRRKIYQKIVQYIS